MKITDVAINNFMGIGKAKLSLADKGLVLIQGVNEDDPSAVSNGAGKSSLADALFWCLYGETARGVAADEVVNRMVGKDCMVDVTIEEGANTYLVSRWRKCAAAHKRSGCAIYKIDPASGEEIDLTGGTDRITQEAINDAIGCTKEVFCAAVYAGQDALPNLPAMTDGELKPLIEQASGVDTLVRAYKIARENLLAVEHEHDSWRLNHVHAERTVTETQQRVEEMKALRASYEAKRKDNLNQLAETLKDHVERARIYQAQRNDVDPVRIQKEIDKLDAAIDAVHAEQEEETRLSVALSDTQGEHMSCKAIYNRAADDARAAAARLEAIKSQVGKLCGECGKTYAEHDLARATELSKAKVVDLITKAREIKEDTQEREKDALEAHRKLAEHRSRRTDIKGTVSERERLANALVGRRRAEDGLKNETENAQKVKARIDALKVEANPYIVLLDGAEDAFQAAAEAFKTSEVAGEELIERIGVMGDVVKVYGPAGVRAHILDNVTPFLNQRTAEYLGTMSDGRISAIWSTLSTNAKGDLVEKFAITVTKDHGGGSFASLSGGEKRKVRLGCALALQDLVASRASKPIDLFIGDELDDALDEAGLERLMTVLETKARERGTVLVISHSDIRDWIRNTATLTMENGLSTLTPGVLA